ncbi:MAG: hypothetical protein AABW46_01115 [Nanoarchaeota archaeon]
MNKFRTVILVGILLILFNLFVFYFFDKESYFVFALITLVGYGVYLFELVTRRPEKDSFDREELETELIKQRASEKLLRDQVKRQGRILKMYRGRLDWLIEQLGKRVEEAVIGKPIKKKAKRKVKKRRRIRKKR